jgi:hypothetical protein
VTESFMPDPPLRTGAESGSWTLICGAEELTLVLYNDGFTGSRTVAMVSQPYLNDNPTGLAGVVRDMAKQIIAQVALADQLQDLLKCKVLLVNPRCQ